MFFIVNRCSQEWRRTNGLDSKAGNVTGFAGLLATLSAGITEFFPESPYKYLLFAPLCFSFLSAQNVKYLLDLNKVYGIVM